MFMVTKMPIYKWVIDFYTRCTDLCLLLSLYQLCASPSLSQFPDDVLLEFAEKVGVSTPLVPVNSPLASVTVYMAEILLIPPKTPNKSMDWEIVHDPSY